MRTRAFFFFAVALAACSGDPDQDGADGGAPADAAIDAGPAQDAGVETDAGAAVDASVDAGTTSDAGVVEGAPTVYFVIRHTERDPGLDPPINAEGEQRAQRLVDALAGAGVDEIVTTRFIRGQQSGQPLSEATGAPITVAPIEPIGWPAFAEQVSAWQRDREVAGRTYVMIGHSGGYNSGILRGLGAEFEGTRAERYQDLALLIREADGTVRTAWLQYGGTSSLDP